MKILNGMLFSILLSGCVGPLVPVVKIDNIPEEAKKKVTGLPIYNETQLIGRGYRILSIVEGISCKNQSYDPPATKIDAINQAKYWAVEIDADALVNIECDRPRGTTLTYNCWESITCTAQAIKFEQANK